MSQQESFGNPYQKLRFYFANFKENLTRYPVRVCVCVCVCGVWWCVVCVCVCVPRKPSLETVEVIIVNLAR